MRQSTKSFLFLFGFLSIFIIMVIVVFIRTTYIDTISREHVDSIYGNIQFKGEVLSVNEVEYGGRVYGVMCIKIDSTNTDSFNRYDKWSCLRIKDGIASMPTGFIGDKTDPNFIPILDAVYAEVNINNSKTVVFTNKNGEKRVYDYWYRFFFNTNILESDLDVCNR